MKKLNGKNGHSPKVTNSFLPWVVILMLCSIILNYAFRIETLQRLDIISFKSSLGSLGVVTVTKYSPTVAECDGTPFITSIDERVHEGGLAVSQDFLKEHKLKYGDKVFIEGLGIFEVNDCMNIRHKYAVDIFTFSTKDAKKFTPIKAHLYLIIRG